MCFSFVFWFLASSILYSSTIYMMISIIKDCEFKWNPSRWRPWIQGRGLLGQPNSRWCLLSPKSVSAGIQSYFSFFFFFILEKFYWSIIALQSCVGFCYTTVWISYKYAFIPSSWGFPSDSACKESTGNAGDTGDESSILELGRSPGGGNGNALQYSCLGNPMNRGAWWAAVQRVTKSQTQLND